MAEQIDPPIDTSKLPMKSELKTHRRFFNFDNMKPADWLKAITGLGIILGFGAHKKESTQESVLPPSTPLTVPSSSNQSPDGVSDTTIIPQSKEAEELTIPNIPAETK